MGATASKDASDKDHTFTSDTAVQFGHGLVNTLQNSTEKTRDIEIQAQVQKELKRLQEQEDDTLKEIENKLSQEETPESLPIDRNAVSQSIDRLSKKLTSQSKVVVDGESVRKAESAVIKCLRLNDRRPLDCWKEVDDFKREVKKLEESFIGKVVGDI